MRIGLLGGSFNPIHYGHLQIAIAVRDQLSLDKTWLVPAGKHPYAQKDRLLDIRSRIMLIQKAISNIPALEICLEDSDETKPSYTDELLMRLQLEHPSDQFLFIVGADNVPQFPQWHNWQWLRDNAHFVAVNRPDNDVKCLQQLDYANQIQFITIPPIPISSTLIRENVREGKPITGLVPPAIEQDVLHLYAPAVL